MQREGARVPRIREHSARRAHRVLTLRVNACTCPQELELLELRGEHNQLIARFAEARSNMEEALEARRCADGLQEACAHLCVAHRR
jgi:hypothetical protein